MTQLYTIGYEGASVADFIGTLQTVSTNLVVDVRELPQSRRPGFSKNILAAALEAAGIAYIHMKQLGDPKHGREAARRGDFKGFRSIFDAHMDLPASHEALKTLASSIVGKTPVLMCYERSPKECHRSIVAERLSRLTTIEIRHLGVRENIGRGRTTNATVHDGDSRTFD